MQQPKVTVDKVKTVNHRDGLISMKCNLLVIYMKPITVGSSALLSLQ